ncbi:MAG: 6-bladed beta-propeller [Porphyromonadaceae bacterium]|nr:MAG: 6-bladed beta-propeller [Porphyromonadaceae bacterium]
MNKTSFIFLIAASFSTITFGQHLVSAYRIPDILMKKHTPLYLEDYTMTPEFIPLETKPECLLDILLQVDADSQKIYVLDRRKNIFIFNRHGEFLNKILPEGKGPGQFVRILGGFALFAESQRLCIYDDSQRKLLIYNSDGKFLIEIKINIPVQKVSGLGKSTLLFFTDALYTKHAYHELSYFDISQMKFIKTLKLQAQIQIERAQMYQQPGFTSYRDELLLRIPFCDTIFRVTSDTCIPGYIFKLGQAGIPKEIYGDLKTLENSRQRYINFSPPVETRSFLFLPIIDHGKYLFSVLNKSTGTWKIAEMPDESETGFIYRNDSKTVFPMKRCINEFFYSTIYAHDFIDQFAKEYPGLVAKIKVDDNPIILRARMK